jgi:predicted enzyme related to lactoylglutathione lyase
MKNPVSWFDLYVSDLERAKNFYEMVFNIQFDELPLELGRQLFFPFDPEGPNISGALVEKADVTGNGNNMMIYFATEDCISEQSRIEKAGGKIITPKMSIGDFGFISIFLDSEGNTVGLHSRN